LELQKELKQSLKHKQELIPKDGKGKYNLTVPVPYQFEERDKERK